MPYPVPRIHAVDQAMLVEIGEELRRERLAADLTQRELEVLSSIDQTTISRVENGLISTLRIHRYARLRAAIAGQYGAIDRPPRDGRHRRRW